MPNLVPFEEIEAIILLSLCQFLLICDLTKKSMLSCFSKILRNLATNKGYNIDDSYRSPSGLNYQTNVMFKYILDSKANTKANHVPKIFTVATVLYKDDINEFRRRLWEGLYLSSDNNKQTFLRFLTSQKTQSASDIFWSLEKAEEYLTTHGLLKSSMYDELSIDCIENFESIILKDNNFIKKHNGIVNFLKMGFSIMKKYITADNVSVQSNTAISVSANKSKAKLIYTKVNDFSNWIIKTYGLTEVTARNYHTSVRRAERIAQEQNLNSQKLFTAESYVEAQTTYDELLKNSKFISLNTSAHNGFTAAINKYLQYIKISSIKPQTSNPQYDRNLVEQCLTLIKKDFPNGIKRGSGIAKRKFLSAYSEKYGIEFPHDEDFDNLLSQITLEYADKYYAIDNDLIDFIREQLSVYPVDSKMVFSYSAFYNMYIGEFSQLGVYSEEMLKAVLEKEFTNYYNAKYFATCKGLTIEQMVNTAYGENICLSLDELHERLQFVEIKKILSVLSRSNSGFVRVADGKYAMEKRVKIVLTDVEQSRKIIENDLHRHGYSFTTSIIVEESEYENPEISEFALQLVLFDQYLASNYSRNRTLIAPFGETVSIMSVMMSYCKQHKRITLKEIEEYEMELTGKDTARRSLDAAVSSMIRVDEETFIDHLDFDIKAVDKAIESFLYNRGIISLMNVTSFSAFPDVENYAWSSYLLASYLRRYSERWGYMGDETKKKSVGVLFDKKLTFDSYDDALAQAVASSGVELIQEEVSYFLLHNEYRLRNADFKDIISKAYQIRMREE